MERAQFDIHVSPTWCMLVGDVELYAEIESFSSSLRVKGFVERNERQFNLLRFGKMFHAISSD